MEEEAASSQQGRATVIPSQEAEAIVRHRQKVKTALQWKEEANMVTRDHNKVVTTHQAQEGETALL